MSKPAAKSTKKTDEGKSVPSETLEPTGPSRRAWLIGGAVLVLLALLALFSGDDSEKKTIYTDGQEEQLEEQVRLREVVWTHPSPLFPGEDDSVDRYDPAVADGGLTLVFVAGLPKQGADLFIAKRELPTDEWGTPQPLAALNSKSDELGPAFSSDGRFLFFSSDREGGLGNHDIWVARREGDGWGRPINLGEGINTKYDEIDPAIRHSMDLPGNTGKRLHPAGLYFASNRSVAGQPDTKLPRWRGTARAEYPLQSENFDLFLARIKTEKLSEPTPPDSEVSAEVAPGKAVPADSAGGLLAQIKAASPQQPWTFEKPQRLSHLNTPARDAMPSVTQLGDYIYFSSRREDGEGGFDILRARWHPELHRVPSNVGSPLNTAANETDPVLYSHGHEMIFSSDRGAGETPTFQLFHSRTTEVIPFVQVTATTPRATGSFWHYLQDYKWWILLLLLALLALLALLKNFLNEETRRTLSLLQRCLLGSIALHILLAFLLSVWVLSHAVYKIIKEEQVLELALNEADVAIQQMSQEIREVVPDLPQAQADLPTEQPVELASAVVQPPSVEPSRPVEVQRENKPDAFAVQPKQVQPMPIHPETLSEMTPPPVLPDQTIPAKPSKQEEGEAQAQVSRTLVQASAQAKLAASQTQNAEANPQANETESVKAAQAAKMAAAQPANPVDAEKQAEAVETAQAQNNLPKLQAAKSETKQEEGEAQAQASQTLVQASAQAKLAASQTQNAEANPQANETESVKAAQAAKMAAAQPANPVDAEKQAEAVETAQTQNNLPKLQAAKSETKQEEGEAQAQASQQLQKATQRQAVKVTAKANQLQSQPNIDAALAKTEVLAQQVATAAVTNAAPIRLSATAAGSLNTVTISPNGATVPVMAAGKTSLEQANPEAKAGQGLVAAKKTSALQAAKVNTPEAEASTKAKAAGSVNNAVTKNVAVESVPVSALVQTAQVQAAKVNAVVPELQVAKTEELEVIEPTVSVEKRLSGAESKQTIDLVQLSSTQSKALRQSVPIVAVIGLKQVLRSNLKQAPALGAVQSSGMTNAKAAAPGVAEADLISVKMSSFDQKPIASQVARKNLKSAMGTVNIPTKVISSVSPAGGPVETDELVQSKALPKLGSIQLAALPAPELNTEPLALTAAGNGVVLPDMEFKPGVVLEAPRRTANPMILRKNPKVRLNIIDRLGGSEETEKAVRRALDWFTRNQEKDGHWRGQAGHTSAATGMAVLAYMGWGAKHSEPGPYQKPLAKAVDWLLRHERNGDLRGRGDMYDHGIAAIAMAEAYSLTKDPLLKPAVIRIVDFTVKAQNPKTGGWRYKPFEENPRDKGDLSVTGWQLMALRSAQLGGFEVPDRVFDRTRSFLEFVGEGKHGGDYRYLPRREHNVTMISEGMFCQQLLYLPPASRRMRESAQYIQRDLPSRRNVNYYYWYYGSLAMHQNQGEPWEKWNEKLRPILVRNQVRNAGREDGSWDPTGKWGPEAGRCVITAMATLSLEVYYRYLPLSSPAWLNKGK